MIEKLLKRLMSETGVLVLTAMEKQTYTDRYASEPSLMYDDLIAYGNYADYVVLKAAKVRIQKHQAKEIALRRAAETAARILMGETFADVGGGQKSSTLQQCMQYAQIQAMNQQAQMNNSWQGLGGQP